MENKTAKGLKIKHANILLGVVSIVLACAIFFICKKDGMQFYMNKAPGPGFMPMISASIIGLCGLGVVGKALAELRDCEKNGGNEVIARWAEWKSFIIIIGISLCAILVTEFIGLITAVTAAVILFIRLLGSETWKTSLIVGIGTGIVIYLIFVVFLKVHVPVGPWGF